MSVCQLAVPLFRSATPGTTHLLLPAPPRVTGETSSGSLVWLSSTEAYAVILPLPDTTSTSMRPSLSEVMPFVARTPLSCRCWPPLRSTGKSVRREPSDPKTFTSSEACSPDASTRPRLVRYFEDCAICCSDRTVGASELADLPMKFANGMAGMCCPNVPLAVTLNVREEANVERFASAPTIALEVLVVVCVNGRTSSVPVELAEPVPNHDLRMSSRATVRPGSIEKVVWRPVDMPASPLGM